jgi:hypothetical protein
MPDIPPGVHVAYQKAFWDRMKSFGYGYSDPVWHSLNAALEAAAPLLAEAWGAFECEPLRLEPEIPALHAMLADAGADVARLRTHLDADHAVMVQLGRIADAAVKMLEHVNMDTDEDREFHARAVGALRARLDEMAATMKEANEAARDIPEVPGAE